MSAGGDLGRCRCGAELTPKQRAGGLCAPCTSLEKVVRADRRRGRNDGREGGRRAIPKPAARHFAPALLDLFSKPPE